MCVIAVYKKGIEFDYEELRNCFYGNPDGAGFMYQDKHGVQIHKGFMDVESLIQELEKLPTTMDRVVHFRIATTGKISPATCHPFPVSKSFKAMGKEKYHTNIGVAHNGILRDFEPKNKMKAEYSDTMNFVKNVLFDLEKSNMLHTQTGQYLIDKALDNSKLAIMTKNRLQLHGDWQASKKSGAMYSNSSYLSYKSYYGVYGDWCCTESTGKYQYEERNLAIFPKKGKDFFTQSELDDTLQQISELGYIIYDETMEYDLYYLEETVPVETEPLFQCVTFTAFSDLGWYLPKYMPCDVEMDFGGDDIYETV